MIDSGREGTVRRREGRASVLLPLGTELALYFGTVGRDSSSGRAVAFASMACCSKAFISDFGIVGGGKSSCVISGFTSGAGDCFEGTMIGSGVVPSHSPPCSLNSIPSRISCSLRTLPPRKALFSLRKAFSAPSRSLKAASANAVGSPSFLLSCKRVIVPCLES